MRVEARVRVDEAYPLCCRLAAMAGEPKPNFAEYNKVYRTPDGIFRVVLEFQDTGRNTFEDDDGRVGKLPDGATFQKMIFFCEKLID